MMRYAPLPLVLASVLTATAAPAAAQQCTADAAHCREVERVMQRAAVRAAFDHIEATDDRAMEELVTLTEVPAPPFMERERGERYAAMLRDAGADSVWMDSVGNVLALRRGTRGRRTVVLDGHLDTVFPEGTDVTVHMRGDTLFAPGVGDDTRGLIVVLQVLRAMEAADIETQADVLFIGTVGEEGLGDLRGVKHVFREGGPEVDAWIAIDGGGDGRIVHRGLGSRRYRVTFKGPGGHSWGAFGLGNPAHALGRAIRIFDEAADAYTASGPRTSYNVGRIGGGTSINSIPFEAWMEVDMRSESPARLAGIDSIFRASIPRALEEENAIRRDGPPLTVDVELVGDRPSGTVAEDAPLVQRAVAATEAFGVEPRLAISSTNANIPIAMGIPAVTLGRGGDGGEGHAPGEWWRNEDGTRAIKRALVVLLVEAGG